MDANRDACARSVHTAPDGRERASDKGARARSIDRFASSGETRDARHGDRGDGWWVIHGGCAQVVE